MKKNFLLIIVLLLILWNVILTSLFFNRFNNNSLIVQNTYEYDGISSDLTKVVDSVKTSTVAVKSGSSVSSGFIYRQDDDIAYIVTSFHGINNDNDLRVCFDSSSELIGSLLGKDIYSDVAVIKVESNVKLNDVYSNKNIKAKDGELLICIGCQNNGDKSIELSMVSNSLKTINNSISYNGLISNFYSSFIQLSNGLSKGYSGAPIYNMNNEIVGMVTLKDDNSSYALLFPEIRYIADQIINNGSCNKAIFNFKGKFISEMKSYEKSFLNISLQYTTGYYLEDVPINSLANALGLKNKDIVLAINGTNIYSYYDLLNISYSNNPKYTLLIIRDGQSITLEKEIND